MLKNILSDGEFWFILFFNGFLVWGYNQGIFSLDTLVWVYFMQSVILGISNTIRLACYKQLPAENFQANDQGVEDTSSVKRFYALFFMFQYGVFHLLYFILLAILSFDNGSKTDLRMIMLNTLLIAGNAVISTWSNVVKDREEKPSRNSMLFTPYLRIFPMHLFFFIGFALREETVIAGIIFKPADLFWFFLTLKIISDLAMHIVVQKSWMGKRIKPLGGYI